jgi:hypothetical protein
MQQVKGKHDILRILKMKSGICSEPCQTFKRPSIFKIMSLAAGKMAQVVEHLPIRHEALNSNPSTKKKTILSISSLLLSFTS